MGLKEYVLRRTINSILLVIVVVAFNFFIFRLNTFLFGVDPAHQYIFGERVDPKRAEALRRQWGIPPPNADFWTWVDYFISYMINTLTFNFGISFTESRPVIEGIMERLPNTLWLMGVATIAAMVIGIILGVIAAAKHGTKIDVGLVTLSLTIYAIPIFWLGLVALLIFGYYLELVPLGGVQSVPIPSDPVARFLDFLWHLATPAAVLTIGGFGGWLILMRSSLMDVLTEDYIVTARAKGLDERTVLYKHALKNAFLPMITVITLSIATLWTGATLTETVFSWYGLGRYIYEALIREDWPVAQAVFYFIAISVVLANFITDLLYGWLDPRIKYD
ncbi:MAG: ABC transporter permease [Candidatus Odinarchaeota archaeon]|nr:ABC transporter permease [Candidatus Odinarchaeota archaeon]